MNEYYIFGNGQFAELLKLLLEEEKKIKTNKIFFVTKKKINKKNHLYEKDFFTIRKKTNVFIGIGNIKPRIKILNILLNGNHNFPNFISKKTHIMKKVKIGVGNIILPNTNILSPTKIGNFNILGVNSNILHHCDIHSNCVIGGGTLVGSGTKIEKNVFIGVGTTISSNSPEKIKIGHNSFVCSGSVIFSDVLNNSKVIGNPARKIL